MTYEVRIREYADNGKLVEQEASVVDAETARKVRGILFLAQPICTADGCEIPTDATPLNDLLSDVRFP